MSPPGGRFAALMLSAAMLCSCASRDLVVVVPEANGHVGAVEVEAGSNKTVLNKAYAGARPGSGSVGDFTADEKQVGRVFGRTLAALPKLPKTFQLYFKNDSVELVPESRQDFEDVFAEVASRPAPDVVVTGHTDTFGTAEENDQLSKDRAAKVMELFIARGIARSAISARGRGSRDLLVPTGDQVHEPKNRRVEVTVR
jgi:outer membrane protein OmpA-like peptidoglycan-associated protein